jgi:hypothetical protein
MARGNLQLNQGSVDRETVNENSRSAWRHRPSSSSTHCLDFWESVDLVDTTVAHDFGNRFETQASLNQEPLSVVKDRLSLAFDPVSRWRHK